MQIEPRLGNQRRYFFIFFMFGLYESCQVQCKRTVTQINVKLCWEPSPKLSVPLSRHKYMSNQRTPPLSSYQPL